MKKTSPTKHLTSSPLPEPIPTKPELVQLDAPTQIISTETIENLVPLVDTPDALCEKFTQFIKLPSDPKTDLKTKIERDFLLFSFFWAAQQELNPKEISLFLGLIHDLYHSLEKGDATKEEIISELENRMRGIGVDGYIGGLSMMRENKMSDIVEYVSISLVQHFELYRFVLTEEREEEKYSQEIEIEQLKDFSSLKVAPLDESVPAAFFHRFINPKPIPTQSVPETQEQVSESKEIERVEFDVETEKEIKEIFEKFPPEKVKKMLKIATERVVEEFNNEVKEKLQAKEAELQARIKKIENKLKN